jgi:uncharacterized membrane protein YhaH (DUF805 family)
MSKLMPVELTRSQYLVRWLMFAGALALFALLEALLVVALRRFPNVQQMAVFLTVFGGLTFLLSLRIWGMDVPRIRNIGWSPWLLLLFLVPIVNLIMQLLLFFTPSKSLSKEQVESSEKEFVKRESLGGLGGQSGW